MTIKEIREAAKLIPNFVMVCENELGEAEHRKAKPISEEEYEKIEMLISKLNNLNMFVDGDVFGSGTNGLEEVEEEV